MQIGDIVKVLAPFNETYSDTYSITGIVITEDNRTVSILGELGAFYENYLEIVRRLHREMD